MHVKSYVIKQANYQLKHKFMFKILQVVIRTKQSIQYHLLVMVLAEYNSSYSLLSCRMMLATSFLTLLQLSNFFKTIVQLAHAPPMISCIHPVFQCNQHINYMQLVCCSSAVGLLKHVTGIQKVLSLNPNWSWNMWVATCTRLTIHIPCMANNSLLLPLLINVYDHQ